MPDSAPSLPLSLPAWRPQVPAGYRGPRIALIHGLLAGAHMQKHLLRFLREAGFADTTLYSNHHRVAAIADDLAAAAGEGRAIALIGYSQGGFQVLKVAAQLSRRQVPVDLMVSYAAGGVGRWYPPQWGFNPRRLPAGVKRYLNAFSGIDFMGTDQPHERNLMPDNGDAGLVENIFFADALGIDHVAMARCYPPERVHPDIRLRLLDRLLAELARLPS